MHLEASFLFSAEGAMQAIGGKRNHQGQPVTNPANYNNDWHDMIPHWYNNGMNTMGDT